MNTLENLMERYPDRWSDYENLPDFSELLDKTIVEIHGAEVGKDVIFFVCSDDTIYKMCHEQDCCENVDVNDISGDINGLLNTPITFAEERSMEGNENDWGTSTWTFYTLATINGFVDIRWLGESNGYYSERVDFIRVQDAISEPKE